MKRRKRIIIIIITLLVLVFAGVAGFLYYNNDNRLTIEERNFIDEVTKTSQIYNVNVVNDLSVFGESGQGVFYDFLTDFEEKYSISLNKVTANADAETTGVSFKVKKTLGENDLLFYKDHYVLVSKDFEIINDIDDLTNKTVGVLGSDLSYITTYIDNSNITFSSYDDITALIKGMEEDKYAIMPLHLYLEEILANNFTIVYHFSDINLYYVLEVVEGDIFSSILEKYYNTWEENITDKYNENLFTIMVNSMGITETDIDEMQSVEYNYGFINNSPYEVISSGNYGGIAAVYLSGFSTFADIEFNFTKYRNFSKFTKAVSKDEVDIYFGYYNLTSDFSKTNSGIAVDYSVIAHRENDIVVNSVNSLIGQEVYVDKNSNLHTYLKTIEGVEVKPYSDTKALLKLNKKDVIIFIDSNIFNYYKNNGLETYTERYTNGLDMLYGFNVNDKGAMYKLLDKYVNLMDSNRVINEGINNHEQTMKSGRILSVLARYILYLLIIFVLIAYLVIRKSRKITIAKKIKKDDKLKFIDQLTLLKNRNYLNENIDKWNNNTVYPQAIVVVDLNNVQSINDIEGYNEGDKQIRAAANSLIKTQLDNSDIIRTDGNEFVIYLVGYSHKQITNYIHKLNREFKKLPYDYGAEFGYSMIIDDIKTIEDALNEATKALKEQKENNESKNTK